MRPQRRDGMAPRGDEPRLMRDRPWTTGTATPAPAAPACGSCLLPSETLVSPSHGQGWARSRPPPRASQKRRVSKVTLILCGTVRWHRRPSARLGSLRGSRWHNSRPGTCAPNQQVPAHIQELTDSEINLSDRWHRDGRRGAALGRGAPPAWALSLDRVTTSPLPGLLDLQPPSAPDPTG